MRRTGIFLVLFGLLAPGAALADGHQKDCPTHLVARGETLGALAERFYGEIDRYSLIYEANIGKIGNDPDLIAEGETLVMPCTGVAAEYARAAGVLDLDGPDMAKPEMTKEAMADAQAGLDAHRAAGSAARLPQPEQPMQKEMPIEPMAEMAKKSVDAPSDGMKKEAMHKDAMHKDAMHEDAMSKDPMHGQDMQKDQMPVAHAISAENGMASAAIKAASAQPIAPHLEKEMPMKRSIHEPEGRLHVLTGGPFAPFAGADLPQGGMMVELLSAALGSTAFSDHQVDFVNDRPTHLDVIMPRGGFGLAVPWIYPDCSSSSLRLDEVYECEAYIASEGFYEFVTEFYARADSPWATVIEPAGLLRARICRPEGYPIGDLVTWGLVGERGQLIRMPTPADCLQALDRGQVDVASMDAAVTRGLIEHVEINNPLIVLEKLTQIDKLRVLALRSDPGAPARIAAINEALATMGADGRWFEIVSRHLRQMPKQ